MPSLKDVEVRVTNKEGKPLVEWGTQKMDKSQHASCYIESKTDMEFRITVQPKMPFPDFPKPRHVVPHPEDGLDDVLIDDGSDYWTDDMPSDDEGRDELGRDKKMKAEYRRQNPRVPYHFLATMRLDGREKFEKQTLTRECTWVFKDVGIDALFSTLGLDSGNGEEAAGEISVALTAEDELTECFGKLGAGNLSDKQESKAGQIEITLEKIVLTKTKRNAWKPPTVDNSDDAGARDGLTNVSHTVGRDRTARTVRTIDAIYYEKAEEGKYATFTFFYRSVEKLQRFGFPGWTNGAQAPSATAKGALAASKLASSSGLAETGRRKREEDEEEVVDEGPVKLTKWETPLVIRGGLGKEEGAGSEKGLVKVEEEDEEL